MEILGIDQIDPVQKAKFEYSLLDQVFNKRLNSSEKQGLLKRLKNIEDKTDNQLRAIECRKDNHLDLVENQKIKQPNPIGIIKFSDEKLNKLAEDVIKKILKNEDEDLEYTVAYVNPYKNSKGFVKNNEG